MTPFFSLLTPRRVARWLLVLSAIYGVCWLLWSASSALTPFIIGIVLAYLLLPLVNRLNARQPRWAAILFVYLGSFAVLLIFFAYLVPPLVSQISQLIGAFPRIAQIQQWSDQIVAEYQKILASLPAGMRSGVEQNVSVLINNGLGTLRTNFVTYLQGLGTFLINSLLSVVNTVTFLLGFFLIPFWLFYVMMDQQAGVTTLDRMLPAWLREDFWSLVEIIDYDVGAYVRGQIILGLAVGTAAGVGLLALDLFGLQVNYILLLAVIAAITELIPVIGPILGAVPAVILGFIDSPTTGLVVLALYVVIQQLENNFLVPRIVGDSVGLHPAVLMVLLVVCSQVFGLAGAILSAPMGAISRDVFSYLYGRLSEPPLPAGVLPDRIRSARRPVPAKAPPPPPEQAAPEPEGDQQPAE
ncbi:AI-2E family transporter [Oscillochloris sp. ZM17-4]|uniref:AI-2E family transporter n=1 Tax=Oscillochloris sp. ZM17-4 TaxID=2866714 RepID=UPI001C72AD9B|nr:AI-2E family transporter [Oscillochloris sp. ZM17-4]MBX0327388.1 AI-2E family transporter [Oscillochloris sp. ZM17-4]